MVRISKQPLKKELGDKLFRQLAVLVAKSGRATAASFLRALLTDTEEVLLAKRLAAVLLLHERTYSENQIATMLHMSPTTIGTMEENYRAGEYAAIIKIIGRSKREKEELWKTIEVVLRLGMPSMGKDRWQSLKRM